MAPWGVQGNNVADGLASDTACLTKLRCDVVTHVKYIVMVRRNEIITNIPEMLNTSGIIEEIIVADLDPMLTQGIMLI